jgi:hypothetical protein
MGAMSTVSISYHGYALNVVHHTPLWEVGIYCKSRSGNISEQPTETVRRPNREEAVKAAKAIVDDLLSP